MMDNKEIQEMARDIEALRKELYEAASRSRITVEGYKVGYCFFIWIRRTAPCGILKRRWKPALMMRTPRA